MGNFSFFKNIKRNKLLFNIIPNLITILRIIITLITICFLERNKINVNIFLCLSALIFVSDVMDGKTARYLNAVSYIGELLDITADIFYVLSMSIIMSFRRIIPYYYVLAVLIELYIFIITSKYIKKDKRYLGFDILGRILAVLYYIIPSIMFALYEKNKCLYNYYKNGVFIIITLLTVFVIGYRTSLAAKRIKLDNIKNNDIFEEEEL